mgnify:FL=1
MGHRFTYVVSPEEERENLTVEWFLRRHGYSRHIITGLKRTEDGIFRNGVRAWTSQAVHAGDVIKTHLVETEPSDGILPRPVPFSVVYEDDDILVVDKPADTPIHPSIGNYENTLANGIAWYFEQKGEPFVYRCINRLDRDTTGLIVLAKHALSAAVLSQAMRSREIHRTYQPSPSAKPLHPAPSTPDRPPQRLPHPAHRRLCLRRALRNPLPHPRALLRFLPPRTQSRNRPHPPDPRPHGLHRPSAARRYPLQQNSRHFPPPGTSLCIALLRPSDHRRTLKLPRTTAGRYAKPADINQPP